MIDLLAAAVEVQAFCDERGWRFCFIGGIAVLRWSQARVTRDIDITLLTGFGEEGPYVEALLGAYRGRIRDAAGFARESRVLLLATTDGIGIDVSFGALPFERLAVERATAFAFAPGVELRTCSAEDLLVMKLFAARAIDWRDAEGIAVRHGRELDWGYVEEQLGPLAEVKGEAGILREFQRLRGV